MADPGNDLRQGPPPRYRVVERDRRLVVIDTRAGNAEVPDSGPARLPASLTRTRFDGSATLTTHPLYDANGPRTLALDPGSARIVGWVKWVALTLGIGALVAVIVAPWLLVFAFVILSPKVRDAITDPITRWLDRVAREAS